MNNFNRPLCLLVHVIVWIIAGPSTSIAQSLAHERLPALAKTQNIFHHRHITEAEINAIADAGFTAIRMCIKPFDNMIQDDAGEFHLDAKWFSQVDATIAQAQQRGLAVIIDNHEYRTMDVGPEDKLNQFLASWEIMGKHFQNLPNDDVFFELLNEPNGDLTADLWNKYLVLALNVVRKTNPNRTVIIGPAKWNSIHELKNFSLPEDDQNIIVTFHYYLPFRFTHQGASWVPRMSQVKDVRWLGTAEEVKALKDDFRIVLEWRDKHKRPILLGEFGAISNAEFDDRVRYYYAVRALAERCGFAWAVWSFKGEAYGLFDPDKQQWRKPLLAAVMSPIQQVEQAK